MGIHLTLYFYFLHFWIGPASTQPQGCYVVGKSQERLISALQQKEVPAYSEDVPYLISVFSGAVYGGGGKGCRVNETLVNIETMDCVTFLENYWALAATRQVIKHQSHSLTPDQSFSAFVQHLQFIRNYQITEKQNQGRIIYLSSAFLQLIKAGLLQDVGEQNGIPLQKTINYVSQHPTKFAGIQDWGFVRSIEKELSQGFLFYYPLDSIPKYKTIAQSGDLVGLVTKVPGLDVSHCGVISVKSGSLKLTHSSSVQNHLVIEQDLNTYLSGRTTISGLIVCRPIFPKHKNEFPLLSDKK
jgi:hypothetical protein